MPSGTFRAFRNRNFTLFFIGQSISQIGTWMQRTAVVWLIYTESHSASMIGVAIFAQQFPSFLLSLFGGVLADRYDRYKILFVTQTASMIQAVLLALSVVSGHFTITWLLILGIILGVINAFDVPARQPMIYEMIDDLDDLPNANSINTAMVNLARMIGPAISGFILQRFGAGFCFTFNALTFVAVITSLKLMNLPKKQFTKKEGSLKKGLLNGYHYLIKVKRIGGLIVLVASLSFFILPYDTLEPVFAKIVLKGNASTFGYLSGTMGLGALTGSFILASLGKNSDLRKLLTCSIVFFGLSLILFSSSSSMLNALPYAFLVGLASILPISISVSIVLLETDHQMRGRIASFLSLGYFGFLPLGSLIVGMVSEKYGAPLTILVQGITAIVIGFGFAYSLNRADSSRQKSKKVL